MVEEGDDRVGDRVRGGVLACEDDALDVVQHLVVGEFLGLQECGEHVVAGVPLLHRHELGEVAVDAGERLALCFRCLRLVEERVHPVREGLPVRRRHAEQFGDSQQWQRIREVRVEVGRWRELVGEPVRDGLHDGREPFHATRAEGGREHLAHPAVVWRVEVDKPLRDTEVRPHCRRSGFRGLLAAEPRIRLHQAHIGVFRHEPRLTAGAQPHLHHRAVGTQLPEHGIFVDSGGGKGESHVV